LEPPSTCWWRVRIWPTAKTLAYFLRGLAVPLGFSRWLSALPALLLDLGPVRLSFSTWDAFDATFGLVTFFAMLHSPFLPGL